MTKYRYPIVIENAGNNYCAYVPDVHGCITTGKTVEETFRNMHDALGGYLDLMIKDGDPIPAPTPVDQIKHDPDDVVREVEVELL